MIAKIISYIYLSTKIVIMVKLHQSPSYIMVVSDCASVPQILSGSLIDLILFQYFEQFPYNGSH